MREPNNHTAWVNRHGNTWVRVDEVPGACGSWWPLGRNWDGWGGWRVGTARSWAQVEMCGPFNPVSATETVKALARVRREVAR